jgi:hypothetical protein
MLYIYNRIYITDGFSNLKSHPAENIKSTFKPNSFEVTIKGWNSRNFKFAINNLNKDIDPEASYAKTTANGLIIGLKKANKSDHWDTLEKKKGALGDEPKPKNKPMGGDEMGDAGGNLMEMMKEMYQSVEFC